MKLEDITPLILTYNEEANIDRTLASLAWAERIILIDSGSTDSTAELVAQHDNAMLMHRAFDNHTAQWNFGLEQVTTRWVLTLDADYVCPASLADELRELVPTANAYESEFTYCILGKPLRGTLYPPRVVLFRAGRFRYGPDGHTQNLQITEPVGTLASIIQHDDRKPLAHWLAAQAKYADLEVAKLMSASRSELSWKDRLRKHILWAPLLTLFYCLFYKGLILDGWPGTYYTLQRVYAELLLSLKLLDARLTRRAAARGKKSVVPEQMASAVKPAGDRNRTVKERNW